MEAYGCVEVRETERAHVLWESWVVSGGCPSWLPQGKQPSGLFTPFQVTTPQTALAREVSK